MPTIDDLNALNVRPRTIIRIQIYSGSTLLLTITEEELIRATVSLRSDLSRINPTLPESEIEIEAYYETDQTAIFSDSDQLEIRYRWYPEGTSPLPSPTNRYFYTDEKVTWSEKVLHIHAVDQVHLLDEELPPIYLGQVWLGNASISQGYVIRELYSYFYHLSGSAQDLIEHKVTDTTNYKSFNNVEGTFSTIPDGGALNSLVPRMTRREAIAKFMSLCHWNFSSGELNDRDNFWPVYVDAGKPVVSNVKPAPKFNIYIEDVGNLKESKEPAWNQVNALVSDVEYSGYRLKANSDVSATMFKQKGLAMSFKGYISDARYGLSQAWEGPNGVINSGWFYETAYNLFDAIERSLPLSEDFYPANASWLQTNKFGMWLLDDQPEINPFSNRSHTFIDLSGANWTSTTLDGTAGYSAESSWNDWISDGSITSTQTEAELETRAHFFLTVNDHTITKTKTQQGRTLDIMDETLWLGRAKTRKYDDSGEIMLLPDKAVESMLDKSNVIGSFTWKGDPRMQPRDVVELQQPDENLADQDGVLLQTEDGDDIIINLSKIITLENITLTHEGGGTVAEITYREGYC